MGQTRYEAGASLMRSARVVVRAEVVARRAVLAARAGFFVAGARPARMVRVVVVRAVRGVRDAPVPSAAARAPLALARVAARSASGARWPTTSGVPSSAPRTTAPH